VSAENVELTRRNIDTMQRALNAYLRDRRSIAAALDAGELWPEWDDFLKRVEDYRLTLDYVEDLGGDRVLAEIALAGRGKDSGARMESRMYQLVTLKDGLVVRIQEYTTRDDALDSAGGVP
jgi:hypothetical protein